MSGAKVKLYDEDRYCIGETVIEVEDTVTVLAFGPEFFVRSAEHPNSFLLANGLVLKNGQVRL